MIYMVYIVYIVYIVYTVKSILPTHPQCIVNCAVPARIDHPAACRPAPCAHRAPGQQQHRRPRTEHCRSTSVPLSRIHIAVPASRRRQGRAHARPWPGPERTTHQLAAAAYSCTWYAPGQVASQQHAGQRRARIEHLASVNVAGYGHNIDLVDVRTLPKIYIAVPAPR